MWNDGLHSLVYFRIKEVFSSQLFVLESQKNLTKLSYHASQYEISISNCLNLILLRKIVLILSLDGVISAKCNQKQIAIFWPLFQSFVVAFDSNAIFWKGKETQCQYKQCLIPVNPNFNAQKRDLYFIKLDTSSTRYGLRNSSRTVFPFKEREKIYKI